MNNVPEFVYNRLLSMSDDEFKCEYTYIYIHIHLPHMGSETVVYFGGIFGWNRAENTHPMSDAVYQTTVEVAMRIMEEATRLRSL